MNIILIILAVIASPFLIAFILGAVAASKGSSNKIRRSKALISLSQMTKEQIKGLEDIYSAYTLGDIDRANRISKQVSPETLNFLINFFDYDNRPIEYLSGKAGKIFWVAFEDKLKKMGYSEIISKIIPGVVMDNYNEVLEEMIGEQK